MQGCKFLKRSSPPMRKLAQEIRPLEYCPEKMVRLHNITEMIDSPRDRIKKPDHFLASAPAEESLVICTNDTRTRNPRSPLGWV